MCTSSALTVCLPASVWLDHPPRPGVPQKQEKFSQAEQHTQDGPITDPHFRSPVLAHTYFMHTHRVGTFQCSSDAINFRSGLCVGFFGRSVEVFPVPVPITLLAEPHQDTKLDPAQCGGGGSGSKTLGDGNGIPYEIYSLPGRSVCRSVGCCAFSSRCLVAAAAVNLPLSLSDFLRAC